MFFSSKKASAKIIGDEFSKSPSSKIDFNQLQHEVKITDIMLPLS